MSSFVCLLLVDATTLRLQFALTCQINIRKSLIGNAMTFFYGQKQCISKILYDICTYYLNKTISIFQSSIQILELNRHSRRLLEERGVGVLIKAAHVT